MTVGRVAARTASLLAVAGLVLAPTGAFAGWDSAGTGVGAASATSVGQAGAPLAEPSGLTVRLTWERSTLASGAFVGRYDVRRYVGASMSVVCTATDPGAPLGETPTATCDDPAPVGQTVTYRVVARIGALWTGPESPGTDFTYDTTAPAAPSAPDLVASDDTGASDSDDVTNDATVTVTGSAEAGSTVKVYRGATLLGAGTATGGVYSVAVALVEGGNALHATATDVAGNVSVASGTLSVTLDTVAPSGTITFPVHGATYSTSGYRAGCAGNGQADACGTGADVGGSGVAQVGVTLLGPTAASGVATGTTNWVFVTGNLAAGSYTLSMTVTDVAGNVSTPVSVSFTRS